MITSSIETADGLMTASDAFPEEDPRAAVLVLHTIRGVNPPIVDVCRRFADAGYRATAPNLHHRVRPDPLAYDEDYMPVITRITDEGAMSDVEACFTRFADEGFEAPRVAVVGFALGASVAMLAAARYSFGAAVSFYGSLGGSVQFGFPSLLDVAPELSTPWLGLYPEHDPGTTVDEVEALRPLAEKASVPTEVVLYPGAAHGFFQQDRPDLYDEASASDSWARTLEWIERHLG